ncbi:MAG: hypothetical protein HRU70_07895 [Phycisphaeraceae bacterium]|nr:MAG: hypothetical protein HRU70_07895 [Phycisphaeraceae bacterium]
MDVRLVKWYGDVVSESGDTAVVYWAAMSLGPLTLRSASALVYRAGHHAQSRSGLTSDPEPAPGSDGGLTWSCPGIGWTHGRWEPSPGAVERELWSGSLGCVRWACTHPMTHAEVTIAGASIRGRGYAERIELTVPPWRLPIDELRWGRAHLGLSSVVWIEWRGPEPLAIVVRDGLVSDGLISDTTIRDLSGEWSVDLAPGQIIVDATIGDRVLRVFPALRGVVPHATLGIHERKMLARATLRDAHGVEQASGWALHEVVRLRPADEGGG